MTSAKPHTKRGKSGVKLSRSLGGTVAIALFLLVIGVFMELPIVYSLVQSVKPLEEIFAYPPKFFVKNPTFDNYVQVYQLCQNLWVPLARYVFNSLFISITTTLLSVLVGSMAAFTLSKSKVRGRKAIFTLIQMMMLYNAVTLAVPQYLIFSKLHLIDTYWVYIFPTLASTVSCFLMKQFMDASVNNSLLEAARIDGAGVLVMYGRIVMPIMKPALMTVLLFSFQAMWSTQSTGTIFSEELKTLPSVMSSVAAGGIARSGSSMAITVLMMIPPILVFLLTQGNVLETMSSSGIKE